jgi:drug/metabolite transporter (DMT)-like permease
LPTTTAPNPALGNVLGILCSVVWALTLLGLRYLERDPEQQGTAMAAVVAGNAFACLAAVPFVWPMPDASIAEWATVAYLGVFQVALAYVFLTRAVRRLSALEVSLLLLLEPVLNPAWTWLVRGEQPGSWTIAGGAIIIAVTAIKSVYDMQGTRAAASTTVSGSW